MINESFVYFIIKNSFKFNFLKSKIIKKHGRLIRGPNAYLVSGALINHKKIMIVKEVNIKKLDILIIFFDLYFLRKLIIANKVIVDTIIAAPIAIMLHLKNNH